MGSSGKHTVYLNPRNTFDPDKVNSDKDEKESNFIL